MCLPPAARQMSTFLNYMEIISLRKAMVGFNENGGTAGNYGQPSLQGGGSTRQGTARRL